MGKGLLFPRQVNIFARNNHFTFVVIDNTVRELRSLSVRDVGELLNVSFTTVSHMENGRAVIHPDYVKKFLKALKFSSEDFEILLKGKPTNEHLKLKCYKLIDEMELTKLDKAYAFLSII